MGGAQERNRRKELGKELKRRRVAIGLTQVELARLAGLNRSVVHDVETGQSSPRDVSYAKIRRALLAEERQLAHDSGEDVERHVTVTVPVNGVSVAVIGTPEDVAEAVRNLMNGTGVETFEQVLTGVPTPRQSS